VEFFLGFNREAYNAALEFGVDSGDEGVEEAFDVVAEISESVKTSKWIGDCFIYTNAAKRLNYLIGNETQTVTHFEPDVPAGLHSRSQPYLSCG